MKNLKLMGFVLTVSILVSCLLPVPAIAAEEEKVVYFLSWGGTIQETFEELGMAEKFEAETGYKVVLTPKGTSSEIIALAIAQRNNPQVDVVMCDIGPIISAADEGIFIDLDENAVPNIKNLMKEGIAKNYVYVSTSCPVMIYNPEWFKAQNKPAPDSWTDLLRPEFAGKILIQNVSNTYGLLTLAEFARLGGGGEDNIEPGFEKLTQVAPGVVDWPTTIVRYEQGFQSGEVVLAVCDWVDSTKMKNKGLPVEIVMPKEGAFVNGTAAGIMKDAPHPEGAKLFLNFLLGELYQKQQADTYGRGSFNTKMVPDPAKAQDILTVDMMLKLRPFDWAKATPMRNDWQERFNKIVAQ